jgi:hypothetical protein
VKSSSCDIIKERIKCMERNNIVYIRGNPYRAAGHGLSAKRKEFESKIISLANISRDNVISSNPYTDVPRAQIYIAHSRGCSRMERFGSKGALKICVDDYQDGTGEAGDEKHYEITQRLYNKIKNIT